VFLTGEKKRREKEREGRKEKRVDRLRAGGTRDQGLEVSREVTMGVGVEGRAAIDIRTT
jgi:hypothetical protein